MSIEYVQVAKEVGKETINLPTEEDGTLLLSTLQGKFPGTSSLEYRNSVSNSLYGIRLTEGRLYPPSGDGWGNQVYLCVFPERERPSLPPPAAAPIAPPVTAPFEIWCGRIIGLTICVIIAFLFHYLCPKCTTYIEKLSYVNTFLTFFTFVLVFVNYLFKKLVAKFTVFLIRHFYRFEVFL